MVHRGRIAGLVLRDLIRQERVRGFERVRIPGGEGKVFQIADQKDPALATHAGHTVMLTGEMKGETITVSKIDMPKTERK